MICRNCGKELSDDSDFCGYCGSAVYESDKGQGVENGGLSNCGNPFGQEKKRFSKKFAIIACLFVGACRIFAGAVFLIMNKMSDSNKPAIYTKQKDSPNPTAAPAKTLQEKEVNSGSENESALSENDKERRILDCTDFTENGLALVSYEEKNGDANWCMVDANLQAVHQLSENFSLDGEVLDYNLDMNGNVFFIFENKYALIYDAYTKIKELPRSEYDLLYRNRYGYCTFERNTSSGYSFEDASYVLMDPELNILSETKDEDVFVYPTESSDEDFYSCEYLFFDDENMYNAKTNASYSYFDIYKNDCNIKSPGAAKEDDYEEVKHSCVYNEDTGKYEIAFLFQYCSERYEDGYYEHIVCVVDEDGEALRVNKIRRSTDDDYSICWRSGSDDYNILEYPGHEGLSNLCFINDDNTVFIYSIITGEKIFDSSDLGNIHIVGYSRYDEYTSIILEGVEDETTYLLLIDPNGNMCFEPFESNTDEDSELYICSYDNGGIFSVQTDNDNMAYYNFKGKELYRIDDLEAAPAIFINGLGCAGDKYFDMEFNENSSITVQNAENRVDENGEKRNTAETAAPETSDGTVIKAKSLEQGYVSVIKSYEEKYGEYQSSEVNARIVWKGVCFLYLLDLNDDDTDELIIGYQAGDVADQASIHYMFDIYGYENQEAKLLASSESWASVNSPLFGWIAIIDDNGNKYVQFSDSSYSHEYYGYDPEGNFGAVHTLRNTIMDGEYPNRWLYNSEAIDDTEYMQLYTSLHNSAVFELNFAEADTFTKIPQFISDAKESLGMQ